MEGKIIKHGSHRINNDIDGYMYNHNISEGYNFNSHIHKCHEFILVFKGRMIYTVEGSEYLITEGDMVMTAPSELHSFSFPEKCVYERAFFHIYPGMLSKFPELMNTLNSRRSGYFNRVCAELVKKYGIDRLFADIERWCENPVPETDLMVLTCAMRLAALVGVIIREESPERQTITENKRTNAALRFIDRSYRESISIADIAAAAYMSSSHISRVFKRETGMTINEYLNMRRITHAKNLIMEGKKATAVYLDCGFSDYSTFYRNFTRFVGMTPEAFRRSQDG